jgi:hypothetical protein
MVPVPAAMWSKVCLWLLTCWDCGFKSHQGHGCVCSECCVLSGTGLWDKLITRPEESYWLWCVVCDLETLWMRGAMAPIGQQHHKKNDSYSVQCKTDSFTVLSLLTYLLTPWSKVSLEKLTGSQLVKKFPAFYGTQRFITAVTSACHLSLSNSLYLQILSQNVH